MSRLENAFALLIGVGNDLPVTARDAKAIRNLLADENLAGYKPENIILLTDEAASRDGILQGFQQLINHVNEESSVFIFYSGHGGTYLDNDILIESKQKSAEENHRHFYLLPHNFDVDLFDETWITANEIKQLIGQINSKKLVFFLDCCHAEGITKNSSLKAIAKSNNKLTQPEAMANNIEDGSGISIISSCRADQQSYILDGDSNSLFTKCLLDVLRGKHKINYTEPYIRITEVTQYLFQEVPKQMPNQKPFVNLQIYDDFAVSRVPDYLVKEVSEVEMVQSTESAKNKEPTLHFRKSEDAKNLILLIHGFTGEAEDTFGDLPAFLIEDERFKGWDIFPMGYTQNRTLEFGNQPLGSLKDINQMIDYLTLSLTHKFKQYKRIAIVAHSLGGLFVQQAILDISEEVRNKISHLVLMASPNNGFDKEANLFNEEYVKEFYKDSNFIRSLRTNWENKFKSNYPFEIKVVAATADEFIQTENNLYPFKKEEQEIVEGNHFSVVKPSSVEDDRYTVISKTILNHPFSNQSTSFEEINITLGNYKEVVDKLLPDFNELDSKGISQVVLALEGLNKVEEAIELIKNHPSFNTDGNLFSLIAGRLKREYLLNNKVETGNEAILFYSKALQIAENKAKIKDIYFNAINLAFLSVITGKSMNIVDEYVEQVKDALKKDRFSSLWKVATQAECALYDGDFEKAKIEYAKASKMANIRQKNSIYSNAYTAYSRLMNTTSKEDGMIQFLTQTFLHANL